MPISTRHPDALGPPSELRRRSISLAVLDEILSPEWEYRYYSFDQAWAGQELMASMRNGCGDDYYIGFSPAGVFIKGFAHESPMSPYRVPPGTEPQLWPGIYDGCPASLANFRDEVAFRPEDVTYCIWWDAAHPGWRTGPVAFPPDPDPDGSEEQLGILDGNPAIYREFAGEYYEVRLRLQVVAAIYRHEPLTAQMIHSLNREAPVEATLQSAEAMGYGQESPFLLAG
jgi:hypothetical protein